MKLSVTLRNKIIEFLLSLPQIHDSKTQEILIYSAGLDLQLEKQVTFGGSASHFVNQLVTTLINYGKLDNGQYAIESLLEATKNYIGQDRKQ